MQTDLYNNTIQPKDEAYILKEKLEQREAALAEYVNKLFEQEERWIMINRIIHTINEFMDKRDVTKFVCREIQKITNVNFCSIQLFDFTQNKFSEGATYSDNCDEFIAPQLKNDLQKVTDFITNKHSQKNEKFYEKLGSIIQKATSHNYILPIIIPESFIAVIYIYTKIPLYTNNSTNIIEIISDNYKQAIERINLCNELERTNRHKTEFIANVTHEFKTPLNAIIGFAELLKSQNFPKSKTLHFIDNIVTNSQHMLHLIEDILDVSKAELNHIDLIYEKCSTKNLIEQVITILESTYIAKNIRLSVRLADVEIELDKTRFKQIIYNLLNNAVKFTDTNGEIRLLSYIEKDSFYFEISDTGSGIAEEAKEKIFEMFEQAGKDVLKKSQGHGLGLFISKTLIKLHGGGISFSNNTESGCTFKFFIPVSGKIKAQK